MKGGTKITCSDCGINIYWNEIEVTKGVGLNLAINTLGLWTNSTKANWQILEKGKDNFKLKLIFEELPLNQIWRIKIEDKDEIDWQIDIDMEVPLRVDEFRIVCLVNPHYKTWISNCQYRDFPRLNDNFQNLYLDNHPVSLVGVRFSIGNGFLPSFILEVQDKNLLPLIQNPPEHTDSHIIGLRLIDFKEKENCPVGYYHLFTGRINLFEKDHLLDGKIESLRQNYLEGVIKKKIENRKSKEK